MGQFKPMVKMETTEPSVELKLKKGGHVNMKKGGKAESGHKKMAMGGGALSALAGTPALIGRPAVNAPVQAPGKPSMASRRKAMMAKAPTTPSGPAMSAPPMKKGGKAGGGKMEKHDDAAQDRAMIKKAMAGKKFATGGVTDGQGGYAKGGIISEAQSASGSGVYRNTKMDTAKPDRSPAKTGGVKDGNGGGFKTGGVAKANAGGFKKGGTAKKAYAAGGKVDSGAPVAMPQGRKPVPSSVRINQLAGTYKRGGKVTPAEAVLLKNNKAENKTAMREAKTDSNLKYGSAKRMNGGGATSDKDMSNGAYDRHYANQKAENEADSKMVTDALMYLPRQAKKAYDSLTGKGAVTTTEREISKTVSPAGKKRGGRC